MGTISEQTYSTTVFVTMILIPGLVGLLLVLTADARLGYSSQLSTVCTETKECLLYDRICENENYEVRYYSSLKWVSTDASGLLMGVPTIEAFMRLFRYIRGTNEQSATIDMTSPVILKMNSNSNSYTMSFLLPSEHQANPPRPTDEQVYFTDMPDMKVYVIKYGLWITAASHELESYYLRGYLDKAGATYNRQFNYAVGYDSPMKMVDRHNEVWYVVEGAHVCPP